MKRKSKKDDTPIEMVIALAIGIYLYSVTKALQKYKILLKDCIEFLNMRKNHIILNI